MAAVAAQEVVLSEKVEELLDAICRQKSKPPADAVARRYLSEIGEIESLNILDIIYKSTKVANLSAFIVHMVKLKSRSSLSPRSPIVAPSTNTPQRQGDTSGANKRMKTSDCTARRVCIFDSPPKAEEKVDLPKDNGVLEALEKLEFRKAFLILNYIGCSKLEDYVSAAQIQSYHGLRMWEFETQIWNDFGRGNCQEKERVKLPDGATGESYYYHCHVNAKGTCRFKGPYLNKAATLLQKTVGDENVLIVKFMELGEENMSADSKMQCPVFNKVAEEGIFVGSKRYRFFVFKDGGKEEKQLPPQMWERWSKPYIKQIVDAVRKRCPETPLVLYINGNGGLLERMKDIGVDVIGLDWTVDMADGRSRLGPEVSVQGNVDPAYLFSPLPALTDEIHRVVRCAGPRGHILNLGHGVLVGTPEEAVAHFFEVAKSFKFDEFFPQITEESKLVV